MLKIKLPYLLMFSYPSGFTAICIWYFILCLYKILDHWQILVELFPGSIFVISAAVPQAFWFAIQMLWHLDWQSSLIITYCSSDIINQPLFLTIYAFLMCVGTAMVPSFQLIQVVKKIISDCIKAATFKPPKPYLIVATAVCPLVSLDPTTILSIAGFIHNYQ